MFSLKLSGPGPDSTSMDSCFLQLPIIIIIIIIIIVLLLLAEF
jgi:hypothetical protein